MKKINTLLVVKNRALGDSVISLSTIEYLQKILPDIKIIYALPAWCAPLYSQIESKNFEILPLKIKSFSNVLTLWKILREKKVDGIFEMFQSGRTAKFLKIYSALNNIPYYFHNHHKKTGNVYDQGKIKAVIQRDLDGAWTFFGKDRSLQRPQFGDFPPQFNIKSKTKIKRIILGVVATRKTKMWDLENYAKLAEMLDGYQIVAPLSNSPDDQMIKIKLSQLNKRIETIELPLAQLPRYFSESTAYIGNDTGLKHIAVAADIPTITLFGPEPPLEWHPYSAKKHLYLFIDPLDCRYTSGNHFCGLHHCQSMICLKNINVKNVFDKFLLALSQY